MLIILRFIIQFGIKKAIKKFGKAKVLKATQKVVAKSKPVKHKTELQRVKEQIVRDKLKPKIKTPKGKIIGKVRRNYGKWEPVYQKPPSHNFITKYKAKSSYIKKHGDKLTTKEKDGIAYLDATRGPGHTLKDLRKVISQGKKIKKTKPTKPKKP